MSIRYFAYGSNMSPEQMARRCPGAQILDVASLNNWRFHVNTRGSASIVGMRGARLYGVLWSLQGWHIATLDQYEGVRWKNYLKRRVQVKTGDGSERSALVYVSLRHYPGRARPNYLIGQILEPAHSFDFPADYLAEVEGWLPHYARGEKMHRSIGRIR